MVMSRVIRSTIRGHLLKLKGEREVLKFTGRCRRNKTIVLCADNKQTRPCEENVNNTWQFSTFENVCVLYFALNFRTFKS